MPAAGLELAVFLRVDGKRYHSHPVWSGPDDADNRALVARLLPVLRGVCRFLNTASTPTDLATLVAAVQAIGNLPSWCLCGVRYLERKGTDVVFDVPGQDRALRIVEGEFAEVLDADDLARWHGERRKGARDG